VSALAGVVALSSILFADDTVETAPQPTSSATTDAGDSPSNAEAPEATSEASDTRPPATPAQIAAWITELDHSRYLVREQASQQLFEAGGSALDSLLATANGELPEPSDRAVWILRRMASGKERSLRRPALERLTLLEGRPQLVAAARETLIALRHSEALEALQKLGGRYSETQNLGQFALPRVVLDHTWRGGDEGLVHLEGLAAVGTVAVIGTDISVEGLTQLQKLNGLQDLLLYSTPLEPDDVERLQKALPHVMIDYRRALLGVRSLSPAETAPATVASVEAGSVAEAAGIKAGDVIQKFEDEQVTNFKMLTEMIGKRRAGEEVTLEVMRGGEPIEFRLKLGAWETFE
jgi:hypothetical protein